MATIFSNGSRPGRLVALVGASGSGKSSVLRAGLAAAVDAGEVDGLDRASAVDARAQIAALDARRGAVSELVVVDQFEELFTLCDDADRGGRSSTRCSRFHGPVVIGVRADFYGELSDHRGARASGRRTTRSCSGR